MAHFVRNNFCICCGVCVPECPNGAFDFDTVEFPKIVKEKCNDCGACADICPTQAIVEQPLETCRDCNLCIEVCPLMYP